MNYWKFIWKIIGKLYHQPVIRLIHILLLFILQVLEADSECKEVKVSYLEEVSPSAFSLPSVTDAVYWHPLADVVASMGIPSVKGTGSRLKLTFKDISALQVYSSEH